MKKIITEITFIIRNTDGFNNRYYIKFKDKNKTYKGYVEEA